MSTLDVTPSDLRTTAEAFTQAAQDVGGATGGPGSDDAGALIDGYGDHRPYLLSPQLFEPGARAQSLVQEATSRYGTAASALLTSCYGISSALHILADAYYAADHEDALAFAFLEPGAALPAGLSPQVDPTMTVGQMLRQHAGDSDQAAPTGNYPGDGAGDNLRTDTFYTGRIDAEPGSATSWRQVERTARLDEDGNVLWTTYKVTYGDGRTFYYEQTPGGQRELVFEVPAQASPRGPIAAIEQQQQEIEQAYSLPDYGDLDGTDLSDHRS